MSDWDQDLKRPPAPLQRATEASIPTATVHVPLAAAQTSDSTALLRALRRRWALVLLAGVAGAAAASALAWQLVPPSKYTARSLIRVSTLPPKIVFDTHESGTNYYTYQRTQITLVKSRLVINAAIRDPAVASLETVKRQSDPVEWLEKALVVEFPGGSEILQVSLSGDLPDDLARLVNAVTNSYMTNIVNQESNERLERHAGLKRVYERYQSGLEERRRVLKSLAESLGSSDKQTLAFKQQLSLDHMAQTRTELLQVQSELRRALVELGEIEGEGYAPSEVPEELVRDRIESHPMVSSLAQRLEVCNKKYKDALRIDRSQRDPSVLRAKKEAEELAHALDQRRKDVRPAIVMELREVDGARQDAVRTARKVKVLKSHDKALRDELDRIGGEITVFGKESLDLQSQQDQIAINAETSRRVGSLVEAIEVEFQAPPRITVLDQAEAPRTKDELKKIRMTAMAGLGAFAMLALGVGVWEVRARRIHEADEVVRSLGMVLVGSIPHLPRRTSRPGKSRDEYRKREEAAMIESINAARTVILHASRAEAIRVVMVTSAIKGEGKTSLSGHLAVSLSAAGHRTLLVDCDLRSPAIHRLFDLEAAPGIAELLRGEATPTEVARPTTPGGPWVITAGDSDDQAIRALALGGLAAAFQTLKHDFDYIVVDSAPVLPVADSLLVAQQVDAVLFSILSDVSRIPKLKAAYERLSMIGVRMLGAVVSGAESQQAAYR